MDRLQVISATDQVARHLREELFRGTWRGQMPGAERLARELSVGRETVDSALLQLEMDGLLVNQGRRRGRLIQLPKGELLTPSLRVAILSYEPLPQNEGYILLLRHLLQESGHQAFFAGKCLLDLEMDVQRVARLVRKTEADAWIVVAGSREVLVWFAAEGVPTMALFGRRSAQPIAGVGPDQRPGHREAVRRLIELGHRRIVILERQSLRAGGPGAVDRAIFEEMASHGIPTSQYNLPDWEDTAEGLQRVLDQLFRITPPTALLIDEAFLYHATKDHLARRGILAPEHVSLVCTDPDPTFAWCRPTVAHIRWDPGPVLRRILRWADNVARGKDDRRQTFTKAEFIEGGTIGPVPKSPAS